MIKAVFFDVANTLLDKPDLIPKMAAALLRNGHAVDINYLRAVHKTVSEVFVFPDKTSRDFYENFNAHLLYALGILPQPQLLGDLFEACTYLPWKPFEDTTALSGITLPMGILSNWDSSLKEKLKLHFNFEFHWILCSQDEGIKKPNPDFFLRMLEYSGCAANEILFVGDSMKLDIHPAAQLGIKAVLIDRYDHFSGSTAARIQNLNQLKQWL
jgi:hypothetical protein